MPEVWRPVVGYEDRYEVSDHGRVRSLHGRRGQGACILKPRIVRRYPGVSLWRHGKSKNVYVHRMVLEAFRGLRPEGRECGHLDGNHMNSRLENLAWITHKTNSQQRITHGTQTGGSRHLMARLTEEQVAEIKALRAAGMPQSKVAAKFGVAFGTISNIDCGRNWRHVKAASNG